MNWAFFLPVFQCEYWDYVDRPLPLPAIYHRILYCVCDVVYFYTTSLYIVEF
jgi:hypothetical protein